MGLPKLRICLLKLLLLQEEGFPVSLTGHRESVIGAWLGKEEGSAITVTRDGAYIEWRKRRPEVRLIQFLCIHTYIYIYIYIYTHVSTSTWEAHTLKPSSLSPKHPRPSPPNPKQLTLQTLKRTRRTGHSCWGRGRRGGGTPRRAGTCMTATSSCKVQTPDPKPQTPDPGPWTPNPGPWTLNPKPRTLDPQPQTQTRNHRRALGIVLL